MASSDIHYDVYNTPRITPIQFGDFVAADGSERADILRNSKFFKRTHRVGAWYAKQEIVAYLSSAKRNLGSLDAALSQVKEDAKNASYSDEKIQDATASADCLEKFIGISNKAYFTGKLIEPLGEDDQFPVKVGPLSIRLDFACLLKSVDKAGNNKVGVLFLNTHKGKGLGQKEDTIRKRNKAGESVALLVFKRLIDEFSDDGIPAQEDALHLYVRAQHFWRAPASYSNKLKNLAAEAQMISQMWNNIMPPDDFKEERAKYHD